VGATPPDRPGAAGDDPPPEGPGEAGPEVGAAAEAVVPDEDIGVGSGDAGLVGVRDGEAGAEVGVEVGAEVGVGACVGVGVEEATATKPQMSIVVLDG